MFWNERLYASGLEFEWENTRALRTDFVSVEMPENVQEFYSLYAVHSDGSLREAGREYVFKEPLSGSRVLKALESMDDISRQYKFQSSYRTSLHVHLDCRDLSFPEDVVFLGAVYAIVEPFIYRFIGNNRDVSNYSIPWYQHPQHYRVFLSTINKSGSVPGRSIQAKLQQAKQYKYSGLNMFSLGDYGTVEFRHAPVSMQKDKIILWLNIIMSLKKFVLENRQLSPEDVLNLSQKMGFLGFISHVFGIYAKDLIKSTRTPVNDFILGVDTCNHYLTILKGA